MITERARARPFPSYAPCAASLRRSPGAPRRRRLFAPVVAGQPCDDNRADGSYRPCGSLPNRWPLRDVVRACGPPPAGCHILGVPTRRTAIDLLSLSDRSPAERVVVRPRIPAWRDRVRVVAGEAESGQRPEHLGHREVTAVLPGDHFPDLHRGVDAAVDGDRHAGDGSGGTPVMDCSSPALVRSKGYRAMTQRMAASTRWGRVPGRRPGDRGRVGRTVRA